MNEDFRPGVIAWLLAAIGSVQNYEIISAGGRERIATRHVGTVKFRHELTSNQIVSNYGHKNQISNQMTNFKALI